MSEYPRLRRFERSAAAKLLIAHFKGFAIGQASTYEDLSKVAGQKINGSNPALLTARKVVEADFDIVIECIIGVGVQRLNDREIVESAGTGLSRIRTKAKRTGKRATRADPLKLSIADRQRQAAYAAISALIAHETKPKQLEALAASVSPETMKIGMNDTLAFFVGRGK